MLSPGDWDVTGVVQFIPAASTSVTDSLQEINSSTALGGTIYALSDIRQAAEVPANLYTPSMSTERISVASKTTFFCGVQASFTVSTMQASGECRARRVR